MLPQLTHLLSEEMEDKILTKWTILDFPVKPDLKTTLIQYKKPINSAPQGITEAQPSD